MEQPIINVQQLHKSFQEKTILHDISFSLKKGSITGLLGPNGSGKTTIIRILNGLIHAEKGDITVLGYNPETNGDDIRTQAGIVTESASLYHEMSAWDNLMFFSEIYGINDPKRIEKLLLEFGMLQHKDELVGTFSTGMKKRIALAKALLHKPKILFLDEPTNGLDPEGIQLVIDYLKKINEEEGITIFICSHVLHQLEGICDNYVFIQDGHVIEQGSKKELETRHLQKVEVIIETNVKVEEQVDFQSFTYTRLNETELLFTLSSKEEISVLLKSLLNEGWVHSCEVKNRTLESLYFQIRGEQK